MFDICKAVPPLHFIRLCLECALVWCRMPLFVFFTDIASLILYHHNDYDYYWDGLSIAIHFKLQIQAFFHQVIVVLQCLTSWMFQSPDLLLESWVKHATIGHIYVKFVVSTRIFYRGVPAFATDRPCNVWFRGLNTSILNVDPHFGHLVLNDLVLNDSLFVS